MYQDVSELQQFYASPMGQMVRRLIVPRIRSRWRDTRGLTVMGLGYALAVPGEFPGRGAAARCADAGTAGRHALAS